MRKLVIISLIISFLIYRCSDEQQVANDQPKEAKPWKSFPKSTQARLKQEWADLRIKLHDQLSGVPTATTADEGLAIFRQATNFEAPLRKEALRIAGEARRFAEELQRRKDHFADTANAEMLPPEILPELDQALRAHIQALDLTHAEIDTLDTQIAEMDMSLTRLLNTTKAQEKLNGTKAARSFWNQHAANLLAMWESSHPSVKMGK